jgi:RNA polymerase II C-terminal domain phosphatase-like 3/4
MSNSATTHIIALHRGTDKARWAKQHGKFLVRPSWVEAAQYLWIRSREMDFPVGENNPEPPVATFSETIDVIQQSRPPEKRRYKTLE